MTELGANASMAIAARCHAWRRDLSRARRQRVAASSPCAVRVV
jgi:hypothetical protein